MSFANGNEPPQTQRGTGSTFDSYQGQPDISVSSWTMQGFGTVTGVAL
jgi:hypothetical protein